MNESCFVLKCGGSTLAALPESFYRDLVRLHAGGVTPVIVHGGGPAISETLQTLNIPTEFVGGLRKTTGEVLKVVEMVLAGTINKQIVRRIMQSGGKAIGLSGEDGGLIRAKPAANAEEIGFVGEVTDVDGEIIQGIIGMGCIPVIAPLGLGADGQHYNINADTAAGAVASALGVRRLIAVTDVPGILISDNGEKKTVVPSVTAQEIEQLIASGEIYGGMIPKVRAAVQCIQGSVEEAVIVDGAEPEVLSKVLQGHKIGTRIVR